MRGKKSMRNRMIRIKIASLMAGLVAAVSLEGCGLLTKSYDFTEAENSIYVEDNATIRAAMILTLIRITTVSTSLQVWHSRRRCLSTKMCTAAPIIAMIR